MEISRLIDLCSRYHSDNRGNFQTPPGLSFLHRDAMSEIECFIYEPAICLILQGGKVTSIGDQFIELGPGNALLVSHDLPVISRITNASIDNPYMAVILSIDLSEVRDLYEQVGEASVSGTPARSLSVGPVEAAWLAPLVRYVELMDNPLDAKVLGPAIRREILYRLLLSPIGKMLRSLLVMNSHASRVSKAIQVLKAEFRSPLSVSLLARAASMSVSSFHEHFKSVTGTTPLQFQKDLRLIEARALLSEHGSLVSEVAYTVGYESPTHFSRDYSKKFGLPPSKDLNAVSRATRIASLVDAGSPMP